jgi:putative tryptophan/tyrosine transport system substrate-binding protein
MGGLFPGAGLSRYDALSLASREAMRRRDFITLLGSAAVAWPLAARAQQGERMRRIVVLVPIAEDDRVQFARFAGLREGLERLGWSDGRNVRIDYRSAAGAVELGSLAKELVALQPDVIFAQSTPVVAAAQGETRTIPIVFVYVSDPVGSGFVASLARPGGNRTGIMMFESSIVGKWLSMLKEMAPRLAHVALMASPKTSPYDYFLQAAETVAPSLAIEIVPGRVENDTDIERAVESVARVADEIERGITGFARGSNEGLIVASSPGTFRYRKLITTLAIRHRLPAVYPFRYFVDLGGLISYGSDRIDQFRRAAGYIDRILKGEKPADLPVQAPTKYELVINLKTAKALGLTIPASVLARADEVIE